MNFVQSTVRRAGCDNDRNCKRARTNKVTRAMMYITIAKTEKETENKRVTVVTSARLRRIRPCLFEVRVNI